MLNYSIIMGRLTRDPDVRQTQSGISVCSFSVAVDRDIVDKNTGQKETDFINVTAWRSTADFVGKYFSKGSMIIVEGHIQVRSYTDKDDNKRTATEIIADRCRFSDSKKKDSNSTDAHLAPSSNDAPPARNNVPATEDEDDLPFN